MSERNPADRDCGSVPAADTTFFTLTDARASPIRLAELVAALTLGIDAAEPALSVVLSEDQFDAALLAIANFIDLKSPYTLGHSAAVAELSRVAASLFAVQHGLLAEADESSDS